MEESQRPRPRTQSRPHETVAVDQGERHTLRTRVPRQIPLVVYFALALFSGAVTLAMGAPGLAGLGAMLVAWMTWSAWWGWRAQTVWRVTLDHGGVSVERIVSGIPVDTRRITRGELVGAAAKGGALSIATTAGVCVLDRLDVPLDELTALAEAIRVLRGAEGEVPAELGAMGAMREDPAARVARSPFALGALLLAPFVPAEGTENPWLSGLALRTLATAAILPLVTGVVLDLVWQIPYQIAMVGQPPGTFSSPIEGVVAVVVTNVVQGLAFLAWSWVLGVIAAVNGVSTSRQVARLGLIGLVWSAMGAVVALVAPFVSIVGCFGMFSMLQAFPESLAFWLPGWEYLVLLLPFGALALGGMLAEANEE
ncbi:MAG: hypothetical protein H6737_31480 [Alphaproteobacteria bacterium]|nr:hypothetical protein [Alphaproteobacteria bacterium]